MTREKFEPLFWMLPYDQQLKEVLFTCKTIAIIGLSDDPGRDSYMVGSYLKKAGYRIIPVNPRVPTVLGERSHPTLSEARTAVGDIDIVDIFRSKEHIPSIVEEALDIEAKVIWMQLGLSDGESAQKARDEGMFVVENKCLKIEHMKLRE